MQCHLLLLLPSSISDVMPLFRSNFMQVNDHSTAKYVEAMSNICGIVPVL